MQLGVQKHFSSLCYLGISVSAVVLEVSPEYLNLLHCQYFNSNDLIAHFKKHIIWDC